MVVQASVPARPRRQARLRHQFPRPTASRVVQLVSILMCSIIHIYFILIVLHLLESPHDRSP